MSKFVVNLDEPQSESVKPQESSNEPKKRRGCGRILGILGIISLIFFAHWRNRRLFLLAER
ncbi:MAG: hypothetical protein HC846_13750 [Blastocatellia bacterium]|nr:hypothetical protein [Blastocatellia bacterium]